MGPESAVFVKLLAKEIGQKKNQDQADVMRVLRTEIRFALFKLKASSLSPPSSPSEERGTAFCRGRTMT